MNKFVSNLVDQRYANKRFRWYHKYRFAYDKFDFPYALTSFTSPLEEFSSKYTYLAMPTFPEIYAEVGKEYTVKPSFIIDGKEVDGPPRSHIEIKSEGIFISRFIWYEEKFIFKPTYRESNRTFTIPVEVYYLHDSIPKKTNIVVNVAKNIKEKIDDLGQVKVRDFAAFHGSIDFKNYDFLKKGIEIKADAKDKLDAIHAYIDDSETEIFPNLEYDSYEIDEILKNEDGYPRLPAKITLNLGIVFKDGSPMWYEGEPSLYVWKEKTINTPENKDLPKPDDAVQVSFRMGEGVKSLSPSDLTMTVQSGEELIADDFPKASIDTDKGYGGEVEWVGNGNNEGLKVSKTNYIFTAKASKKPDKPVKPDKQYANVTFDAKGGKWDDEDTVKTLKVEKGKTIKILEAPKRDGYKFLYWKGSKYLPGEKYEVKADHTFEAVWEDDYPLFPGIIIPGGDLDPDPLPEENPKEDLSKDEDKDKVKEENKEEREETNKDVPSPKQKADQSLAEKNPPVIPKDKTGVKDLENLDIMEKALVISKVEKVNPKAVDVMIDNKGNVTLIYADGSTNFIPSDKLVYLLKTNEFKKQAKAKNAANNPKTDISSLSFLLGAMAAAGAGLYVTNKKK